MASKTQQSGLTTGKKIPKSSGVYAAFVGGRCIYVGSTTSLKMRLKVHKLRNICEEWRWKRVCLRDLQTTEQFYIDLLKPELNKYRAGTTYKRTGPKSTISVWLKPAVLATIERLAAREYVSRNHIVRRAIVSGLRDLGII